MADFSAKDVKGLRDATGAGMMDAKKALTETDGDYGAAVVWLRERGLGKAAERADRDNTLAWSTSWLRPWQPKGKAPSTPTRTPLTT